MGRRGGTRGDAVFKLIAMGSAAVILGLLVLFVIELTRDSWLSIVHFGPGFLVGRAWDPVAQDFGALSSIYGTVVASAIAMLLAVPMSFFVALFLVEIAPPGIARPVGYAIELLAGIPSIVFGMWGLFVVAPVLADHVQPLLGDHLGFVPLFQGPPMGIGMFTAGIILAIMILPFMTAVIRDVLAMTPRTLREAAFGMGSTVWEVSSRIMLRNGMRAIVGGLFLGLGRALGETMAVTFVIGNDHSITASLFHPANTIASTLANEFSEASEPLYLSALTELGLILLLLTFLVQGASQLWLHRYQGKLEGKR